MARSWLAFGAVVALALSGASLPAQAGSAASTGKAPSTHGPSHPGTASRHKVDFNGDGFEDLAISAFAEDVGTVVDAGAVQVMYGSAAGLSAAGNQFWSQDSPGILDQSEPQDLFGRSLGTGDFNDDGFTDLAIGAPHEALAGVGNIAGAVNVLYGSAAGLTDVGNQFWTQDSPGILDQSEGGDLFGRSVDGGDFNGDGFDDLAIGVGYEGVDGVPDAGAVNVIYGSAGGLAAAGNQFWTQDSPGILDDAEPGERFGWAVTANDFNGDGFADLAIGNAGENPNGVTGAGGATVIYGSAGGLTDAGNQLWTQDSDGILDQAEPGDLFSRSVRSGDFNGDGFADLVAGVPSEDLEPIRDTGGCEVIYGSAAGLTSVGNQFWSQSSPRIRDRSEAHDHMCRHEGVGDFNGDGFDDLAAGVVSEDVGNIQDAGAVNIIYGGPAGLTSDGNQFWTQDSPDIQGVSEINDAMGRASTGYDFNDDGFDDLAVGVPGDHVNGLLAAGAVNIIYGSAAALTATGNQLWSQDSPDMLDDPEAGDLFGAGLTGLPAGGCGRGGDCTDD